MNTRTTAAALAAAALLALTACSSSETGGDSKPKTEAKPPAYTVVDREEAGHTRQITIEVDSTKGLRAVFDDATKDLSENAGYTVLINCSTGGTKSMDNRLANGTYAIGNYGSAATGLDDGEKQFEPVTGRTCPAKG
ncbi:hypothetical protein [Streptomyces parvulus]|uniref:hypothetical protein n=1 Tax=Streptomyces parvulus TaxID=146923 RepID=UPI0033A6743C